MPAMNAAQPAKERRHQGMKAAELFVDTLVSNGVEVVFGHPGGNVLPLYDALYNSPIRHVLVRHEQAAAHMADGYARSTGKVGVCMATSGPGATNLVTGLATAHMDSIPMVAITGNVSTHLIGTDAFQEADIVGITRPVTKHNYLVRDVRELPTVINEAFRIATTGRPGPVLIDIPKDIGMAELEIAPADLTAAGTSTAPAESAPSKGNLRQIRRAAQAIAAAARPVLYIGGGVIAAGADEEVRTLAEKANLPTTFTLMGIGAFPGDHPLSLGMLGMHGSAYANYAVAQADLLIAIGARFDDRVTGKLSEFAKDATVVHIDVDPAEIGKNVSVDIPIVGDAKGILQALIQKTEAKRPTAWLDQIALWKREYPLQYRSRDGVIAPQQVIEEIYRVTDGEAVCVADVGQHQMWLAQYYRFRRPRSHLSSGGLGTMGFGLPAAIGAKLGRPDQSVWAVTGDGSFQMNIQELATCAAQGIPVKIAILNNSYLGMVRQWQELLYEKRYAASDLHDNPDFATIATGFGVAARTVKDPDELAPALEWAERTKGPILLDIHVDEEANVYPMVPSGHALHEMIGPKGYLE